MEITLHYGAKAAIVVNYLPQPMEEHERSCYALARLLRALSHHLLLLGGDIRGAWTGFTPKDVHVQFLPFLMWEGAETPIFTPPRQPGLATCIDHLIIWNPRHLADQIGKTITLPTSFLYHKGFWGPSLFRSLPKMPILLHPP